MDCFRRSAAIKCAEKGDGAEGSPNETGRKSGTRYDDAQKRVWESVALFSAL